MITIQWTLFKPSGKWYSSGLANISGKYQIWDRTDLLNEIAKEQKDLSKEAFTRGYYYIALSDSPMDKDETYKSFYNVLYTPTAQGCIPKE